jgi:HlyD family secretion protein
MMSIKGRRIVTWGGLGLILLAGLAFAFWPRPIPVDLATATRGAMMVTIDEEGETRVRDVFQLSSPVTGRVRRIELEVGDQVIAEETVVAEIEPVDPEFLDMRSEAQAEAAVRAAMAARALAVAELEQAEAELEFAQSDVERSRRLIRRGTISQRALDDAERNYRTRKAAVATANAALEMREYELERARAELLGPHLVVKRREQCDCVSITAPVSGRVLRVYHESEGVVEAGDPLIEIGDPKDLEIVVDLLSSDAVKVKAGQRVIVEEWGGEGPLAGRVERVEPYGFTKVSALGIEEQRVNVIVDFEEEPEKWQRLGHGYQVETRVVIWESQSVLKLSLSALFRVGDRWAVFVEEQGRAQRRLVRLGRFGGFEAEILDGLAEGERVVLHPSDRVIDGVRIASRS